LVPKHSHHYFDHRPTIPRHHLNSHTIQPDVKELQPKPIDPVERQDLLGQVSLMTWAFVRSMKRHLSPPQEDEEDYVKDIEARLAPEQAEALIGATHRPNRALFDLSVAIEQVSPYLMPMPRLRLRFICIIVYYKQKLALYHYPGPNCPQQNAAPHALRKKERH
jgi:hypothetical protein